MRAGPPPSTTRCFTPYDTDRVDHFRNGRLTFPVIDAEPVAGAANGEVVVLLHGFPQAASSWNALIPALTEAGYRVLAPDQRGYARGALPKRRRDYAMPHLVGDVLALLDEAGPEKAHVVGHDWGGAVAWSLAAHAPERLHSLTVLSTPHPAAMVKAVRTSGQGAKSLYMLFFQLPWLPEKLLNPQTTAGRKRLVGSLRGSGQDRPAAERDADQMAAPGVLTGALNWYRGLPFSGKVAGRIEVPTLYLWGRQDKFLGRKAAELTAEYVIGHFTFRELDGGHWIQGDVAEPLLAHLCLRTAANQAASCRRTSTA